MVSNPPMQLTSPDAAQSAVPSLCLLSGLAADWHVVRAKAVIHSARVAEFRRTVFDVSLSIKRGRGGGT